MTLRTKQCKQCEATRNIILRAVTHTWWEVEAEREVKGLDFVKPDQLNRLTSIILDMR